MSSETAKVLMVSCAGPPKSSPESLQVSKYLKYLIKQPQLSLSLVTEKLPKNNFGWRTLEEHYAETLQCLRQVIYVPVYYHRYLFALFTRMIPWFFHRPDNEAIFTLSKKKVTAWLQEPPQVIYSRSTPFSSAVLALKLQKHYKVPWLFHLSDPWVESPHFKVPSRHLKYHQTMEAQCFESAHLISFTSWETAKMYERKYPQYQHKYLCFPNVYDDDSVFNGPTANGKKLRIVHTGNFYGQGRRPLYILRIIKRLEAEYPDLVTRAEFLFTGFCSQEAENDFKEFNCKTARHLGAIGLSEVVDLQRSADILLLIDWNYPQPQAVFQLSKTMDYMAAGKPMVAITTRNSTVYRIVENVHGKCFEHQDESGLLEFMINIINRGRQAALFTIPRNLDKTYAASTNARKLAQVLRNLARTGYQKVNP